MDGSSTRHVSAMNVGAVKASNFALPSAFAPPASAVARLASAFASACCGTPHGLEAEDVMRQIALIAVAATVATVAGVAAYMGSASGQSSGGAAPIYGIKILDGYRDWRLVSVKRLTGAQDKFKQLRAELANDIAFKAFRDGTLPFPDGSIIAALHWKEASSDADNKVLAAGFPGPASSRPLPGPP